MRITLIGPAHPLRGGIAHHVYLLSRELAAAGHHVQVVSYSRLYPRLFFPGRTMLDQSRLKMDVEAEPILDSLNPGSWFSAYRSIRAFGPDIAIVQWWTPILAPALGVLSRLLKQSGVEIVADCHNLLPHEGASISPVLVDFALSPAASFITHSEEIRARVRDFFPGRPVYRIPLPSPESFSSTMASERNGNTLLFFGLVRKYKGLDVLLKALPEVISQADCKLLVTGEFYDPLENYLSLIARLHLEDVVQIEDRYVPNEEVPEIFGKADVLIMPYLSATQSGILRIAQANCLPIIAARTAGLAEAVEEDVNGLLFDPGNARQLARQIVRYLKEGLGPSMAENMRAQNLNVDLKTTDVIDEIVRDMNRLD